MRYKGRAIDPVKFWSRYVDFPSGVSSLKDDTFLPKVVCPNPDHDTLKKHFQINAREPYVHCFAHCGISGSWEHAVCIIEGLYEKFKVDWKLCQSAWSKNPSQRSQSEREQLQRQSRARREAKRIILRASEGKLTKNSKPRKKHSIQAAKSVSPGRFQYDSYLPQVALEYLEDRKIGPASISAWKIGWLPDERRIVIPAYDADGRLRFLIKRAVRPQDQPKYLYTEGFPKTALLFGACALNLDMIRSHGLVIVEGSLDTIIFHQHGLKNTVGILGTGISEQQRRIIAKINPPKIYDFFDKDAAGVRNIEIAASVLRKYPQYVCKFPKGKSDPAELTKKEAHRQIGRAVPISSFVRQNGLNVRTRERKSFA